jgi:Putative zinc-binding metallo-peptidase
VRICDLKLRIEGSELEPRVRQFEREIRDVGLALVPTVYLADEWLCPDGETAVGVPFYLAHPRLKSLEFRMMFEIEGGTPSWCLRLLRHEAGHAFDHAYKLSRRESWRRVFGSRRAPYNPYFYLVDPESTRFVRNVPDNYGQCHPDEDFAETFAVWLNPNSQWRARYKGWPAMRKLLYVDRIMKELKGKPAPRRKPRVQAAARTLRSTLRSYYERKFRLYQLEDLSFAARQLRTIFRVSRAENHRVPASAFLRKYRRTLIDSVVAWSGERESQVERVVDILVEMCDELNLVRRDPPDVTLIRTGTFVTTLVVNRLRGHSYRTPKP